MVTEKKTILLRRTPAEVFNLDLITRKQLDKYKQRNIL